MSLPFLHRQLPPPLCQVPVTLFTAYSNVSKHTRVHHTKPYAITHSVVFLLPYIYHKQYHYGKEFTLCDFYPCTCALYWATTPICLPLIGIIRLTDRQISLHTYRLGVRSWGTRLSNVAVSYRHRRGHVMLHNRSVLWAVYLQGEKEANKPGKMHINL